MANEQFLQVLIFLLIKFYSLVHTNSHVDHSTYGWVTVLIFIIINYV